MHQHSAVDYTSRGARINSKYGIKDYPRWTNKLQQDKWRERGLILWDNKAHQITRLTASQALAVLEHLRTDDSWKKDGLTLGEPATTFVIDEPEREPETVLTNQISLTAVQVQELFELLQSYESTLNEVREQEEEERNRRLDQAYRLILGDEIWHILGRLYQKEPEETLKLAQELIAKRLGK